jgi:hypothetical protein
MQRVRCQACGRTQALLPDFLHPHRWYVLRRLHQVVLLYLLGGLGFEQVLKQMPSGGPARETIREWVNAFAYGAGYLLLEVLRRFVAGLGPLAELPQGTPRRVLPSKAYQRPASCSILNPKWAMRLAFKATQSTTAKMRGSCARETGPAWGIPNTRRNHFILFLMNRCILEA